MPDVSSPTAAVPDSAYVVQQRALLVDLCAIFGAANAYARSEIDDFDADGNGGLLLRQYPTIWLARCGTSRALNAIADAAYRSEVGR